MSPIWVIKWDFVLIASVRAQANACMHRLNRVFAARIHTVLVTVYNSCSCNIMFTMSYLPVLLLLKLDG